MAREKTSPDAADPGGPISQFNEAIGGLSVAEAQQLLQHLFAAGRSDEQLPGRRLPASRRRPRRPDVVTYRVRVDLDHTQPPLWRRLELASDLDLDAMHDILQAAFGWTDSHLHRFGSGPSYYDHATEYYLCPFDVDEGEPGIPEGEVRLDEVLVERGEKLFYNYDFGDGWDHTITLEAVLPRDHDVPRAVCTTGRRPGPAEDCGGVPGYELISAATDPTRSDHTEAVAEYARVFGSDVDPASYAATPFDVDEINGALAELELDGPSAPTDLPAPLEQLVLAVRSTTDQRRLRRLIGDAGLDRPALADAEITDHMVEPYTWLLDRVGDEGIKLTGAGYLPPIYVEVAVAALGLAREWIGKGNREVQTLPVLQLRESAQKMGLLRKRRGRLDLTSRGRKLRTDPVALWWHLAERMPLASRDLIETQAGLMLLILVAAGSSDDAHGAIADFLNAIGWRSSDGMPLTPAMAVRAAWDTDAVLRRLGALPDRSGAARRQPATADGTSFARAALRTWPASR